MHTNRPMTEQTYIEDLDRKTVQSKKSILFFTVIIFAACLLAGCVHFFYQVHYLQVVQLGGVLLLGIAYAAFMQKKSVEEREIFSTALFLAAGLFISLSIFYFFKGRFQFLEILLLSSAFLLPSVIMEAWRTYNFILSKHKPSWVYSKDMPDEPLFVYLENKPVRVKMLIDDHAPVVISSVAPLSLKLGMAMFYIIKKEVQDSGGKWRAVFLGEDEQSHKWIFYTRNFFKKTYFNPEDTLFENKIRSNTLIIAKRLDNIMLSKKIQ
jgi:hypothetical protein